MTARRQPRPDDWRTQRLVWESAAEGAPAGEGYGPHGGFAGYASVYRVVDSEGDLIERGAFARHLQAFLERGVVLWQHSTYEPIGRPVEAREDARGLWVSARLVDTQTARDCRTLLQEGVIDGLSIGFWVRGYQALSDAQGEELLGTEAYQSALRSLPWWRQGEPLRLITDAELLEVSPVTFPANPAARVTEVRGRGGAARLPETEREFRTWLEAAGYSERQARALAEGGYPGLARYAAGGEPDLEAVGRALADCRSALTGATRAGGAG